jgi:DNA-binding XRE family transcriptional regulator
VPIILNCVRDWEPLFLRKEVDAVNNRFKLFRFELGFSQEYMAEQLGVSLLSYRNKENGHREFKLSEIKKIIVIFGKKFEEIF